MFAPSAIIITALALWCVCQWRRRKSAASRHTVQLHELGEAATEVPPGSENWSTFGAEEEEKKDANYHGDAPI